MSVRFVGNDSRRQIALLYAQQNSQWNVESYVCSICDKKFARKDYLTGPIWQHIRKTVTNAVFVANDSLFLRA